jgi:hypothetical protein
MGLVWGQSGYSGLTSWYSPGSVALAGGGSMIPSTSSDQLNPAAIRELPRLLQVSLIRYPADIQGESVVLVYPFEKQTVMLSLKHLGYGEFEEYDNTGERLGDYVSGDTWLSGSTAVNVFGEAVIAGISGGFLISQLQVYQSVVASFTGGLIYRISDSGIETGIALRHAGLVVKKFTDTREKLPLTAVASIRKRLAYLPFEFEMDIENRLQDGRTTFHLGGIFYLPHHFTLLLGTNTNKQDQSAEVHYLNDFFGSSGAGLIFDNEEYRFGFSTYFFTTGGWIVGLGMGVYF